MEINGEHLETLIIADITGVTTPEEKILLEEVLDGNEEFKKKYEELNNLLDSDFAREVQITFRENVTVGIIRKPTIRRNIIKDVLCMLVLPGILLLIVIAQLGIIFLKYCAQRQ